MLLGVGLRQPHPLGAVSAHLMSDAYPTPRTLYERLFNNGLVFERHARQYLCGRLLVQTEIVLTDEFTKQCFA